MKIGFFDSGIGGLTVLYEALNQLPREDYLYYADSANLPYGTKTANEICGYVLEAMKFITGERVKAAVIACNTATSAAIQDLRKVYSIPIIGMEPAVKPALKAVSDKRVLVLATPLTLWQPKFNGLLKDHDDQGIVDFLAMPELVTFAEEHVFDEDVLASYLENRLHDHDLTRYGAVVLGCTHFVYFEDHIRTFFPPGTEIVNGNKGTVQNLKNTLISRGNIGEGTGKIDFYRSGKKLADLSEVNRYFAVLRGRGLHRAG
jgi:glutamate racemase